MITVLAPLLFASVVAAAPARVERDIAVMGTTCRIEATAASRRQALAATEAAARAIEATEGWLSTWRRGGELDRLNHVELGAPTPVSAELAQVFDRLFEIRTLTDGAFEPAVRPLVDAWGLRQGGRWPTAAELAVARMAVASVRWDTASRMLTRGAGSGIDEGAWAKGLALDRAVAEARQAGATAALIDLGGQVAVIGRRSIDLADPDRRQRAFARIELENASASTSGNSERAVVVDGRAIGHLLDPRTGRPATDFGSVTVIASDALVADALSTALFVLGPEKGWHVSERLRERGIPHQVLYFVRRGAEIDVIASPPTLDWQRLEPSARAIGNEGE